MLRIIWFSSLETYTTYHAVTQADRYAGARLANQVARVKTTAVVQSLGLCCSGRLKTDTYISHQILNLVIVHVKSFISEIIHFVVILYLFCFELFFVIFVI